ncbi:sterol carrier family protein [Corynebacterium sp. MSK041]|uniref:sterol carrier family protein n=1 Tax=Corynebacterium sp. MSK041 TaxID=3050194 RepID=UPI00254A1A73|nr:sterol carrier family protein [Corynebacterium sp. MSK041]MDK8794878.1 sterol carrier family protein [Corynebacterium sp. MSK041]
MAAKNDPLATREAIVAIAGWIVDPESAEKPSRTLIADACRRSVRALAAELPGHTVELRVPPFVAVQCVEGPRHTRGTPPNVVEMAPEVWLQLATGLIDFEDAVADGRIQASGSRAGEVAAGLPVIALPAS